MNTLGPFDNEEQLVNECRRVLQERGFRVQLMDYHGAEENAVPLVAFRDRLGIKSSTMTKALNSSDCPAFNAKRGPTGRIVRIHPNAMLIAYLEARFNQQTER